MRIHRMFGVGVALATAATAALAGTGTVLASSNKAPETLRADAARVGLRIGTALAPANLSNATYAKIASSQFSVVTPENEMKWQTVEPTQGTYDWSGGDQVVKFAEQNHQLVRGHVLLWHNQLPDWLTTGVANGTISDAQLLDLLHKHVTDEVTHFKGKIWQWDVANEFFTDSSPSQINQNDFWISHLGTGVIADAFRWAHEADPKALLFYNDYNIAGEDGTNAKSDAAYAFVQQLIAQGVPISGVGDQGHLDTQYGFPTQMTADLQRFADLGLKVAITEADVRTFVDGPTTQVPTDHLSTFAQPYEFSGMLQACLAVQQCISFTTWEFGDAYSWIPGVFKGEGYANLYDVNLAPKPVVADLEQDLKLAAGAPNRDSEDDQ